MTIKKIKQSNFTSVPRQADRLTERHNSKPFEVERSGFKITVNPGVYQTSGDTELMIESVQIKKSEKFLEVGSGTGLISIALAKKAHSGIAVDINSRAVENGSQNAEKYGIQNLEFRLSDIFENVKEKFDVVICNPPYTKHEAKDVIDKMFWDPEDEMKRRFFKEVGVHLKPNGRIYFGWADFADIDVDLVFSLAETNGYRLIKTFSKTHHEGFRFYVFEFAPAYSSIINVT